MFFKYKGYDSNGKETKGKVEAKDIEEAKLKVKNKNIMYTDIKENNFNILNFTFKRRKNIKQSLLANIARDISIYLSSGLVLITTIELMKQRYKNNMLLKDFFDQIHTYLNEGQDFATALENQKIIHIPIFFKESVKISQSGGLLQSVLLELSIFLKEQDKIKKQATQALTYPIFILTVSFAMLGFMLSVIVPKITQIFIQLGQDLPTSTKIVISLGDFFSNNIGIILFTLFSLITIFIFLLKTSKSFKYGFDMLVLKIPFIKELIEYSELARFAYMNSVLIKSGVPIVQTFNLSANILKNSVLRKVFIEASDNVVEGKRLSTLLFNNKTFKIDESFVQAISIGEDTSKLDEILQNQAELYNESNKDKITMFISLLEPMFMLFVGLTIGFIVISMLLPIFSMNLG